MTKVSRLKLGSTQKAKIIDRLWEALSLKNKDEIQEFWGRILTPTEITMFAKRVEVLKQVNRGLSYSEIRGKLKVTDNTINKMSNVIHRVGDAFLKILLRLDKDQ
ncbi:MAG: hypothetical protein FJ044_02130 [Candidatus Cloacimonetes bacterium]|nr:hypothetical protein [Candidatus Cloacimonadota bacterium]